MALPNMVVYNEEIRLATIELLAQKVDLFNEASLGAIMLNAEMSRGYFTKESFYSLIVGAQRRVDRNAANTSVAAVDLAEDEFVGVKAFGGYGPVRFEPSQMTALMADPAEGVLVIGEAFADALLHDQLNTSVAAAVAAIENQTDLVNDVSATGGISQIALNGSHAKFGDSSTTLVTQVMEGVAYHKLIGDALANQNELFSAGSVLVVDILGKRTVVSDIPALFEAGTPNKTKVLTLAPGGIMVSGASDIVSNLETTNGNERIETTWQADYSFVIKLKGYAWDTATGGQSPSDAAIATGTNWDPVVQLKLTAGVMAIGDRDAAAGA